jgi:hypothetical protein
MSFTTRLKHMISFQDSFRFSWPSTQPSLHIRCHLQVLFWLVERKRAVINADYATNGLAHNDEVGRSSPEYESGIAQTLLLWLLCLQWYSFIPLYTEASHLELHITLQTSRSQY